MNNYYDSILEKDIIEIGITPKDTNKHFAYANVFITSNKHQIVKIRNQYFYSKEPDEPVSKYGIYRYSDSESLLIFTINNNERLELSYFHEFYGNSFYDPKSKKTTFTCNVFAKLNVIGIVKNGKTLKNKLPEMQYNKNIYDQEYNESKSFILKPNIEYVN